jgi:phosphoesterase RecJ-like protein
MATRRTAPHSRAVNAPAEPRVGPEPAARATLPPLSPPNRKICRAIGRLFDRARDVVLTTHVNPDGDGLGSEAALAAYLQRRGVRARILNADPAPRRLRFLATEAAPFSVYRGFEEDGLAAVDALVVLDTSVGARLGSLAEALPRLEIPRLRIDHHASGDAPAELDLVDPGASSTAELVYRLLVELGAELEPAVAVPLYVGIVYDTGSFRYANTTFETHLAAADLYRHGVRAEALYTHLHATHSAARMRLWGRAFSALTFEGGGRLAWVVVDRTLLAETGATEEDLDGLVEQGRSVEGVEVSILFREDASHETKVSFRSNGAVDVDALARRFGGGGHRNAAGATVEGPRQEAIERVLEAARRALPRSGGGGRGV